MIDVACIIGVAFWLTAVTPSTGGAAVAEWLQQNFFPVIEGTWATSPERDIGQAFVQADETLLQPKVGGLLRL